MKKIVVISTCLLLLLTGNLVFGGTTEYFISLSTMETATVRDGLIMVALSAYDINPQQIIGNDEGLLIEMTSRGVIEQDDGINLDDPLQKGGLAGFIMRGFDISGGLLYSITGTDRYAYRECYHLGIFRLRGSEYQHMTGADLITIMTRANEMFNPIEY